jgi:ribosomal protein S19
MMLEKNIQSEIMRKVGSLPNVRLFRNNVGQAYQGKVLKGNNRIVTLADFRVIRFGLMVGSGDLIGFETITITPDMVGNKIAVFTSIETKKKNGIEKVEQENWMQTVNRFGGQAGFARSVEDAMGIISTGRFI